MEPVFVVFIVFGSTGFILWRWIDARHKERMAMIANGLSPTDSSVQRLQELLKAYPQALESNPSSSLKWGLVAAFVGGGLMMAMWLDKVYFLEEGIYPATMLIAGGLALILFYFISSSKQKKAAPKE